MVVAGAVAAPLPQRGRPRVLSREAVVCGQSGVESSRRLRSGHFTVKQENINQITEHKEIPKLQWEG